ncbi:MAG: hypothetical protein AABX40_05455 [Candidatus Hydrothermarchaeota archaeon]
MARLFLVLPHLVAIPSLVYGLWFHDPALIAIGAAAAVGGHLYARR